MLKMKQFKFSKSFLNFIERNLFDILVKINFKINFRIDKTILLLHKIPEGQTQHTHTQNKKIDYNPAIFITACFSSSRAKDSLGNHNF